MQPWKIRPMMIAYMMIAFWPLFIIGKAKNPQAAAPRVPMK
jgi:hypothetical protein